MLLQSWSVIMRSSLETEPRDGRKHPRQHISGPFNHTMSRRGAVKAFKPLYLDYLRALKNVNKRSGVGNRT